MVKLVIQKGTLEASFENGIQETEKRISGTQDLTEEMDTARDCPHSTTRFLA